MNAPCAARFDTIGDVIRNLATIFGDKPAIVGEAGQSLSFAELVAGMGSLAQELARHGARSGDRIAILSKNRPEYIETVCAASEIGAATPLNWRLTADDILYILCDCRPQAIFADGVHADLIDRLRPQLPFVGTFVCYDEARTGWLQFAEIRSSANYGSQAKSDDVACIIYTSGTTGRPKGAELTHQNLLRNCDVGRDFVLRLEASDITLAPMPLFHVGGLWYHFFPSLSAGSTIFLQSAFDAEAALRIIRDERITNMHVVPTMLHVLIELQEKRNYDLSSLRIILYAASSIPQTVLRKAMQTLPQCDFVQSYGSTESGYITCLSPEDHREAMNNPLLSDRLLSCGRSIPGAQLRLCAMIGNPDPSIGEIEVKNGMSMRGYIGSPPTPASDFDGEWLRMGDIGRIDENGYLTILDRKNDMIVTGGENVFPRDIEDVLLTVHGVQEAAVFDIPDEKWVQRVAAAVVIHKDAGLTSADIAAAIKTKLAGFRQPKSIFVVDELPKNAAGKVLRKTLRERYGSAIES